MDIAFRRLFLSGTLIDTEIACAWDLHRLSLIDGPPAWCTEQRALFQKFVDRHREKIAYLRAQLATLDNVGVNRSNYSAAAE